MCRVGGAQKGGQTQGVREVREKQECNVIMDSKERGYFQKR